MFGVRHSKFKNIFGDPRKKELCYDQIKIKVKGADPPLAAVNGKYLAVMISCSGVDVMVRPLDQVGRVESDPMGIKCNDSITTCIEWCPRDDSLLLIGLQNGEINFMRIPDGGLVEVLNTEKAETKWSCEYGAILNALWHPSVGNMLLTSCGNRFAGHGLSPDTHLVMWDIVNTTKLLNVMLPNCYLTSLSFNFNGSKILCTDNSHITRVVDLRAEDHILQEAMLHKKARRQNTVYLRNGCIFSAGYSPTATREYALWDENDLSKPLELVDLDNNSGILFPIYDADINLIYLWGKGDSNIHFFEVVFDLKPCINLLGAYQSSKPQSGIVSLPKLGVNVAANEVTRLFKFYANGFCEVIPIICPRREQGFSDEIYPPTPGRDPNLTIEEWLAGIDGDPKLICLESGEVVTDISNQTIHASTPKVKTPLQKINEIKAELSNLNVENQSATEAVLNYENFVRSLKSILQLNEPVKENIDKPLVNITPNKETNSFQKHMDKSLENKGLLGAVETFVDENKAEKKEHEPATDWTE